MMFMDRPTRIEAQVRDSIADRACKIWYYKYLMHRILCYMSNVSAF